MDNKSQSHQNPNEIPFRSPDYIESKAEEVIEHFAPEVLRKPGQTPLGLVASETSRRYKVTIDFSLELGETSPGNRILGAFRFHPPTIRVDSSLVGTDRFPFVFAHEYGHFVLHRNLVVKASGYSDVDIADTQHDFITGKKKMVTPRDRLEWQANRFAAALIMPRATVRNAVISVQNSLQIIRRPGIVYVENDKNSLLDFHKILAGLAFIYKVTTTNMEYRLNDLKILDDHRDNGEWHISELLREKRSA